MNIFGIGRLRLVLRAGYVRTMPGRVFDGHVCRHLEVAVAGKAPRDYICERSFGNQVSAAQADLALTKNPTMLCWPAENSFRRRRALQIGRGTPRKMRQNLGWAVGYNVVALPIAAGVFEPAFGLVLRPEMAALSISESSFIVAVNALMLKRLKLASPPSAPSSSRPVDHHTPRA